MALYSLVLFVHLTAVLTLGAALSFEVLSLYQLRRASSLAGVERWIRPVPGLPLITAASAAVILLSGIYLTIRMSAFALAWPKVTIGALLLLAPFSALTGKRMRAIHEMCVNAQVINPVLARRLEDPLLKVSLAIRAAVFLGIVLLMSAKPDLLESILVVGAAIVFGLLSSLLFWRRTGFSSVPDSSLGD